MEIIYKDHLISIEVEETNGTLFGCYVIRYARKALRAARVMASAKADDEDTLVYQTLVVAQGFVDKAIAGENIA